MTESLGCVEPAEILAPAVLRKELLQFLESMKQSGKNVQLALDHSGDFHQAFNLVRALVGEGKGQHKKLSLGPKLIRCPVHI